MNTIIIIEVAVLMYVRHNGNFNGYANSKNMILKLATSLSTHGAHTVQCGYSVMFGSATNSL